MHRAPIRWPIRRLGQHDRGAATLETVGMLAVAAVLASAVMLVVVAASPVVGDRFRQAICMFTTLGRGSCESSMTSAEDHQPTEPCVVSANGHSGAVEVTFVVTVGANEQFLVEQLNNGKYRVTRSVGGKVGAGVGVGANVSVTWDDKQYGAAAAAGVSAAATFTGGEVYYADNDAEVKDLIMAHTEDVAKNVVAGSGPVGWLTVTAGDLLGVGHDFPPVNETYIEGGASIEASAQATALISSAQAGAGIEAVLGTRQGADGTSTTYYQASGDFNIGGGTWAGDEQTNETVFAKAGYEIHGEFIVEVESDAKANITAVRMKRVTSGNAEATAAESTDDGPGENEYYTETMVELPIHSVTDQAIAQRYLTAMGMGPLGGFKDLPQGGSNLSIVNPADVTDATTAFGRAAGQRGFVTNQNFDDSGSSAYGAGFDAEFLAKVSGGASVDTVGRTSLGAEYFDGSHFVPWQGCSAQ